VRHVLDRVAARAARAVLAWSAGRVDPWDRVWIDALRGELDAIGEGRAQLDNGTELPLMGGRRVSAGEIVELGLIGHPTSHLESIRGRSEPRRDGEVPHHPILLTLHGHSAAEVGQLLRGADWR
jgi:hypothetical protein